MKTISQTALHTLMQFEGFLPNASNKLDGVYTIGYGHTLGVKEGDTITPEQARYVLLRDLQPIERLVRNEPFCTNQHEFDALVLLIYNIGTGAYLNSTLRLKIINYKNGFGTLAEIHQQWLRWSYCRKKFLQGLYNRRQREFVIFIS